MSFPRTLPTDNLYRFIGLSGLVIIVGSCVLIIVEIGNLREYARGLEKDTAEVVALGESAVKSAQRVHDRLDRVDRVLCETRPATMPSKAEVVALKEEVGAIERAMDRGEELMLDWGRMARRLEVGWRIVRDMAADARENLWFGKMGLWVGGLLLHFGFALWYLKLQRPKDQLLAARVRRAELGVRAAQAEASVREKGAQIVVDR